MNECIMQTDNLIRRCCELFKVTPGKIAELQPLLRSDYCLNPDVKSCTADNAMFREAVFVSSEGRRRFALFILEVSLNVSVKIFVFLDTGIFGKGRPKCIPIVIGDVLHKGQVRSTHNRRTCKTRYINVDDE